MKNGTLNRVGSLFSFVLLVSQAHFQLASVPPAQMTAPISNASLRQPNGHKVSTTPATSLICANFRRFAGHLHHLNHIPHTVPFVPMFWITKGPHAQKLSQ